MTVIRIDRHEVGKRLAQLKMSLTIIFVFVLSSMTTVDFCMIAFYWLSTSWMKLIKVAGLFVGPKGITV